MLESTEAKLMTGPEAYAKAVEYANKAAEYADARTGASTAQSLASVAQAYAAIAAAEATARCSARPGYLPGGGWSQITDPDRWRY
ncbi:hypothetical protein [Streptomyces sp. NPDC001404]|uniref:hypothetical protein n=1 Tax=Streptomyces sp. NPDC001404 TaxID=3364571 RepID=UPI0036D0DD3A